MGLQDPLAVSVSDDSGATMMTTMPLSMIVAMAAVDTVVDDDRDAHAEGDAADDDEIGDDNIIDQWRDRQG